MKYLIEYVANQIDFHKLPHILLFLLCLKKFALCGEKFKQCEGIFGNRCECQENERKEEKLPIALKIC